MKRDIKGISPNVGARGWIRRNVSAGSEAGQTLVEFALALPLLLALTIGAVDLGRLVYMSVETSNAAHAGARYGCQNSASSGDFTGMRAAATNDAPDLVGTGNGNLRATVTNYCQCSDGSSPNSSCNPTPPTCSGTHVVQFVSVSTTSSYTPWFPYPGVPSSVTLHGSAVMQVRQ
jgi:Flp pilus assembly protein TadG